MLASPPGLYVIVITFWVSGLVVHVYGWLIKLEHNESTIKDADEKDQMVYNSNKGKLQEPNS